MARKVRKRIIAEINVTPFVDVLLIVLIIFMITAPMITTDFDVSLPKTNNNIKPLKKLESINLTVDIRERIYKNHKLVIKLDRVLSKYNKVNTHVFIRADKNVRYEAVIKLMNNLKRLGFENISLVTEVK